MSRHEFAVAYAGTDRKDDHSIDVQTLAPALLAFGKLLREANNEFNGKKSTSKVLVVSDFEHKCFHVNFELLVSWYNQVSAFLGGENVKTAKEVLEWVGLIGGPASAAGMAYLRYLSWKKGRPVESVTPVTDSDETGLVEVRVAGNGNTVHVHQNVYKLSENATALKATKDAFLPLGRDGFDAVQLKNGHRIFDEITQEEVQNIVASCNSGIDDARDHEPDVEESPAWLSVYSPVYDPSAPSWRFRLGKDIIYADISATTIAEEAIQRGGAMVDDAYQVRLEITTEVDGNGNRKSPKYKVIEVTRFVPAAPPSRQTGLFEGND